jgi:hypothetical protein
LVAKTPSSPLTLDMTVFLNIALLIVGTMATLAAFGGKTWAEGSAPIYERITPRGWISLVCLACALSLGVIKEFRTRSQDAEKDRKSSEATALAAQQQAESDRKAAALLVELTKAEGQVALANERLDGVRSLNTVTKMTLDDVRTDLRRARVELSQQSAANLITVIANGNQSVRAIWVYVPVNVVPPHYVSSFRDVLLPMKTKDGCLDEMSSVVHVMLPREGTEEERYQPGDPSTIHESYDSEIPKVASIISELEWMARYLYQDIPNYRYPTFGFIPVYSLQLRPSRGLIPASAAYLFYTNPAQEFVFINAPPSRSDKNISAACSKRIEEYFRTGFDRALLIVALNGTQNEKFVFHLHANRPKPSDGNSWEVQFNLVPPADFITDDLGIRLNEDWPQVKQREPQ